MIDVNRGLWHSWH